MRASLKEADTQFLLEARYLVAYGRGGEVQFGCGNGKTATASNGFEREEVANGRKVRHRVHPQVG